MSKPSLVNKPAVLVTPPPQPHHHHHHTVSVRVMTISQMRLGFYNQCVPRHVAVLQLLSPVVFTHFLPDH